jgi:hypothetical protein
MCKVVASVFLSLAGDVQRPDELATGAGDVTVASLRGVSQ